MLSLNAHHKTTVLLSPACLPAFLPYCLELSFAQRSFLIILCMKKAAEYRAIIHTYSMFVYGCKMDEYINYAPLLFPR